MEIVGGGTLCRMGDHISAGTRDDDGTLWCHSPPTVPNVSAKLLPLTRIVVEPRSGPDEGESTSSWGRSNQEKLVSVYCWALRESESVCDAPSGVTQRSTPASRS